MPLWTAPLGREGSAPLVPGFRRFRGFCPPLAGGFKGWWYRPAGDEFYSPLGGHRPPLEASPPSTTSWTPSPRKRWEARLKSAVLSSMLPAHPLSGGGWRAQRDGRGQPYGPLCGPGSEGSEGSARLWQAGSKGGGIALRAMSFIARLAGTGLHWRPPPPPPLRGPPPPASGGRQGLRAQSSPPCYLPTPFPGVGGERSETERGGCMGHSFILSFMVLSISMQTSLK